MDKIIEFQGVSKSFGDLQVVNNLDMHVHSGEKLALIGPSGSGKTTILRILMTLETIDAGHVIVDGDHLWHQEGDGTIEGRSSGGAPRPNSETCTRFFGRRGR